jgi:ribosome maturation factor RimP
VSVRTADRKRVRGQLVGAGEQTLRVDPGKGDPVEIPYDSIVRGNLIEEGAR